MVKKLLLTYDYELFLGSRSGSVNDCQINPTEQTLEALERYQAKAVFFIDTSHLIRLFENAEKHEACRRDFDKISMQLQRLVNLGHYVYPHIHPHWLDAHYVAESNEWTLTNTLRYCFSRCTPGEQLKIFDNSISILKKILHRASPDYKIDGYRAGGWSLQPFSFFKPHFEKHGIQFEMSVLSGIYSFTDAQYFDFTSAPRSHIYSFATDECMEQAGGPFTEFTISSVYIPPYVQWLDKAWLKYMLRVKSGHAHERGSGHASQPLKAQPVPKSTGYDLLNSRYERIAIELLSPFKLSVYRKFLRQNSYMHFISHPKMIADYHHRLFESFLEYAFQNFEIETDFKKMLN